MIKLNKQTLQVCILAFMLLGIQTVQSSFTHDHIQHQADCVLCHIDTHDQVTLSKSEIKCIDEHKVTLSIFVDQVYFSSHYPSYQGRSPPLFHS